MKFGGKRGYIKQSSKLPRKVCTICQTEQDIGNFYFMPSMGIRHSHCNPCRLEKSKQVRANKTKEDKRNQWLKTYGLTNDDYNNMFTKQQGKCKCCGIHQSELKHPLFVDHCHNLGNVRGLLCRGCNTALGLIKDNVNTLKNMIEYLDGNRTSD